LHAEVGQKIRELRLKRGMLQEELARKAGLSPSALSNFEQGRRLYGEVACASCHRFVDEGGSLAPELTAVAGRFGIRDLLEAIVAPSREISDQYGAIVIRKKDGTTVTGRVANLTGPTLNVVTDMFEPGRFTNVRREDIESIETSRVSMMPASLLNSLKAEEVQDLMAYMLSRGDPKHRMFR